MRIRIYYEDTDCGGIVYHTNYIKYCERARSELFFGNDTYPSKNTSGFVVSSIEAQFLGFARLGDLLEIQNKILKIGKVQIVLMQEIFKIQELANPQNLCEKIFSTKVKLGYVDVIKQKPMPIPQDFINLFLKANNETY